MPKRSNQFQKLVLLVKKHVAGEAVVEESAMLRDRISGKEREVDVCITSKVADSDLTICIECVDKTRPADITWVEQMKSKHEHLPTDKLILASNNGFTEDATRRAGFYGFETLALGDFDDSKAEELFTKIDAFKGKSWTLEPTKVTVRLVLPDQSIKVVILEPNHRICDVDGEELGDMKSLVQSLIKFDATMRFFAENATELHKGFRVEWDPIRNAEGKLIFALQEESSKELHQIEAVCVFGKCDVDVSEFPLERGRLGGINVVWGTGSFAKEPAMLVASGNMASIQFGNPGSAVKRKRRRKRREK